MEFRVAPEDEIRKFIRRHYGVAGDTLEALGEDDDVFIDGGDAALADSDDAARDASVVRLVNTILLEGIRERATDIHIEPYEDRWSFATASTACSANPASTPWCTASATPSPAA